MQVSELKQLFILLDPCFVVRVHFTENATAAAVEMSDYAKDPV